ncbi:MAG: nucleotide pyrophosphohydrolase [Anaerolineales bacterium]|nr:nucleotide pyrophosphohydrolase [Anaerolineales bacterium]
MTDDKLNLIMEQLREFRDARDWEQYHSPKNLAFSIAIEAAELLEIFQWVEMDRAGELLEDPAVLAATEEELADILIYCLNFADRTGIDPLQAVLRKIHRNEERFPPQSDLLP